MRAVAGSTLISKPNENPTLSSGALHLAHYDRGSYNCNQTGLVDFAAQDPQNVNLYRTMAVAPTVDPILLKSLVDFKGNIVQPIR